ncbi:MAG: HAD family hydrolase [Weeksellaceae bacterium]
MYQTILFDLDGCLVHSLPAWVTSFTETYAEYKITKTEAEIVHALYHFDHEADTEVDDPREFSTKVYTRYRTHHDLLELHEYVPETLKQLKAAGKSIGVVTSSTRETALSILESQKILDYFDVVMAWEDTETNKPDPEPVLEAIKRLSGNKKTSIMIGDSDVDIIAAQQAGITSVWYHPVANETFFADNHFSHLKPDYTVKHFQEFLDIVNKD